VIIIFHTSLTEAIDRNTIYLSFVISNMVHTEPLPCWPEPQCCKSTRGAWRSLTNADVDGPHNVTYSEWLPDNYWYAFWKISDFILPTMLQLTGWNECRNKMNLWLTTKIKWQVSHDLKFLNVKFNNKHQECSHWAVCMQLDDEFLALET